VGVALLRQAADLGINFFDTADVYGNGRGETILAEALGSRRDEIVVATKFGYQFGGERSGHQELPQNFSPEWVRAALEASLKRLETDRVDLYQLHNPRLTAIQRDDLFAAVEELREQGKVRYWGVALGPDIGWFEEGRAAMLERRTPSLQIIYSLLEQEPARHFFPLAQQTQTGLLVRVPHASGLLEGTVTPDTVFDPGDHRAHRKREWLISGLQKVERLQYLVKGTGRTLAQAAIKFCLSEPTVVSVLPNITSQPQLEEFVTAVDCPDLTEQEVEEAHRLYDQVFTAA